MQKKCKMSRFWITQKSVRYDTCTLSPQGSPAAIVRGQACHPLARGGGRPDEMQAVVPPAPSGTAWPSTSRRTASFSSSAASWTWRTPSGRTCRGARTAWPTRSRRCWCVALGVVHQPLPPPEPVSNKVSSGSTINYATFFFRQNDGHVEQTRLSRQPDLLMIYYVLSPTEVWLHFCLLFLIFLILLYVRFDA